MTTSLFTIIPTALILALSAGEETQSTAPVEPVHLEEKVKMSFPKTDFGRKVYLNTDTEGMYENYGKILKPNVHYSLDGVNGCNAIFIYTLKNGKATAVVTHFDSRPDSLMANGRLLEEFSHDPRLKDVQQAWATMFYSSPWAKEDIPYVAHQVQGFTHLFKGMFGPDTKVRYMPYKMMPPGTYFGQHSLEIDLNSKSLKSVWHGEIGATFSQDQAFKIPLDLVKYEGNNPPFIQ